MNVYFELEMNEIEKVDDLSYYNHIMWKMTKPNKLGITHFVEVFDDVDPFPMYEFGIVVKDKFKCLLTGEGDPIPDDKIGMGGVFIPVLIHYPEVIKVI